jgi:putative SOS response-associated peptidase YedK
LTSPPERLAEHFETEEFPEFAPRFNIAPGQDVATIRIPREGGGRVVELRRWGLVPPWAKDPRMGSRMINARAETAAEKPAFRKAFRLRRCLVPADGFYEWARGPSGKQPYHVVLSNSGPFGLAGLWEHWEGSSGEEIASCTLLTTRANERLRPVHERMPVILDPADYGRWLDPDCREPEGLSDLLAPCPDDWIELHPVSRRVNDVSHDDPGCIAPVAPPTLF